MDFLNSDTLLATFIVFCRVGGCLMLAPGFGSARIPARVRLMIAIAVSLALAPGLTPPVLAEIRAGAGVFPLALMVSELVVGLVIGLLCQMFFLALRGMAGAAAQLIGFGNGLAISIDGNEPEPYMASFIGLAAVTLLFVAGGHWEILRGLMQSYRAWPVAGSFSSRLALTEVTEVTARAFYVALEIIGPFVVYSVIVNFAVGLVAKFTPQIPIYFVALPVVLYVGLFLLYLTSSDLLRIFMGFYLDWLKAG